MFSIALSTAFGLTSLHTLKNLIVSKFYVMIKEKFPNGLTAFFYDEGARKLLKEGFWSKPTENELLFPLSETSKRKVFPVSAHASFEGFKPTKKTNGFIAIKGHIEKSERKEKGAVDRGLREFNMLAKAYDKKISVKPLGVLFNKQEGKFRVHAN